MHWSERGEYQGLVARVQRAEAAVAIAASVWVKFPSSWSELKLRSEVLALDMERGLLEAYEKKHAW